jgi:hypothetical protein
MHFLARRFSIRLSVVVCLLLLRPSLLVLATAFDQSRSRHSAIEYIDDDIAFLRVAAKRETVFQAPPAHDSAHAVTPAKGVRLELFATVAEALGPRLLAPRLSILAFSNRLVSLVSVESESGFKMQIRLREESAT